MCIFQWISSAQYIDQPLDCRELSLGLRFYQLNKEQVIALRKKILLWACDLVGDAFVFQWHCDERLVGQKSFCDKFQLQDLTLQNQLVTFDAYAVSPVIHNLTELKKYKQYMRTIHPVYSFGWDPDQNHVGISIDYPKYFDSLFPCTRMDNGNIIENVYRIFCEPNRHAISLHLHPDFRGLFNVHPYREHSDSYYGQVEISFSAFSLNGAIDKMADIFVAFAKELAEQYVQLNIHVRLQPRFTLKPEPYMHYFGKSIVHDSSHEEVCCSVNEWYPTYYLCGVEWLNILSPLAKQHVPAFQSQESQIIVQELDGGCLFVQSAKPITKYNREDALQIKKYLLPALYPGRGSITLRGIYPHQNEKRIYNWCPRFDWAIVPVEKEEIDIVGTDLVYWSASI